MTSSDGTFFSAQDADTNGEEGQTFVWKKQEIEKILGPRILKFSVFITMSQMAGILKEIQSLQITSMRLLWASNLE